MLFSQNGINSDDFFIILGIMYELAEEKEKNEGKKFFTSLLFREIVFVILIVFAGAVAFQLMEGHSYFNSLYFTVMTMTTVGYGDITPQTAFGKIFVMIYALLGVPLFISLSGLIIENRFNKQIKSYIEKIYKEIHSAQRSLGETEARIEKLEKKVKKALQINFLENETSSASNTKKKSRRRNSLCFWKKKKG